MSSDSPTCLICTEKIKVFAIGECGHSDFCWKCILTQRTKMEKLECAYCKTDVKVLLSKNQEASFQD